MHRMFKYRLYPSKQQETQLKHHLIFCKGIHNTLLHHCRHSSRIPSQYTLNKLLPALKQDKPEYASVHSQVLQNISKRIGDAYHGYYARREAGLKAGRPRYKSADRYKSMTYPQSGFNVEGDTLVLSKIGSIRIRLHRPIRGDVKTLTVKYMPSGRWYAVFCCKMEAQPGEKPHGDMGVDLGLECFAALSDGTRIENPRFYRGSERRLAGEAKTSMERLAERSYESEEVRRFAAKIRNGMDHWFTFLMVPGVEPTNNRAERALREHVVQRRIMGCFRNGKGTGIYETVMTVLASWKQQGRDLSQTLGETLT